MKSLKIQQLAGIVALAFILLSAVVTSLDFTGAAEDMQQLILPGSYLLSGIQHPVTSTAMPLFPFIAHFATELPATCNFLPLLLNLWILSLLLFVAGISLRSAFTGLLAAALFATAIMRDQGAVLWRTNYLESLLYTLTVLCVLFMLFTRAATKKRELRTEILLAVSIGTGFMIKSPLFLLPPVLILLDILSGKLKRSETDWRNLLALGTLPYLMLLPWVWMNYQANDILTLFEHNRSKSNIITGALGVICTVDDANPLIDFRGNTSLALWALRTICHDPLRYIASVLARAYTIFSWHPLALTLFLGSIARHRHSDKFRLLAVFAAYFIAIHCLLSIEPRYFFPLWPAILLGVAAFFDFSGHKSFNHALTKAASAFCLSILGLMTLAYAIVSGLLLSHATHSIPVEEALSSNRRLNADQLVTCQLAKEALKTGRTDTAYEYARQALLAKPSDDAYRIFLYALIAKGRDVSPLLHKNPPNCAPSSSECDFIAAANALRKHNYRTGLNSLAVGLKKNQYSFRAVANDYELSLYKRQQLWGEGLQAEQSLKDFLAYFPPAQAAWLIKVISRGDSPEPFNSSDAVLGEFLFSARQICRQSDNPKEPAFKNIPQVRILIAKTAAELARPSRKTGGAAEQTASLDHVLTALAARLIARGNQLLTGDSTKQYRSSCYEEFSSELMRELLSVMFSSGLPVASSEANAVAQYLTPEDLKILSRHNNPAMSGLCNSRLAELERARGIAASVSQDWALPDKQAGYTLLAQPEIMSRFKALEKMHNNGEYARLIQPAKNYLNEYPSDPGATLFLSAALIVTGEYAEAAARLDRAVKLPLAPHEKQWHRDLSNNLYKELARKKLRLLRYGGAYRCLPEKPAHAAPGASGSASGSAT